MLTAELTHDRNAIAIQDVLTELLASWNRGDAEAYGALFSEDADYVIWNGMYDKGRDAIVRSHTMIFSTFYRDSRLEGEITQVRYLSDEIALVHLTGQITLANGEPAGFPTCPLAVMQRHGDAWLIVAWQNTPVMPHPHADDAG
jgi:uncharacterized protein (TIGR02246 family)